MSLRKRLRQTDFQGFCPHWWRRTRPRRIRCRRSRRPQGLNRRKRCPMCRLRWVWHPLFPQSGRSSPVAWAACRKTTRNRCPVCPKRRCHSKKRSRPGISCPSSSHHLLPPAGPKTFTIHTSLRSGTAAAKTFARCKSTTPPDQVNTPLTPDRREPARSVRPPLAPQTLKIGVRPPAAKGHRRASRKICVRATER